MSTHNMIAFHFFEKLGNSEPKLKSFNIFSRFSSC